MKELLLYLWQLPQNLLGELLVLIYRPEGSYDYDGNTEKHEWGHTRQSRMLGPLYLIVIGLPSLLWAAWWNPGRKAGYFDFYTEKWADRLGGIER